MGLRGGSGDVVSSAVGFRVRGLELRAQGTKEVGKK